MPKDNLNSLESVFFKTEIKEECMEIKEEYLGIDDNFESIEENCNRLGIKDENVDVKEEDNDIKKENIDITEDYLSTKDQIENPIPIQNLEETRDVKPRKKKKKNLNTDKHQINTIKENHAKYLLIKSSSEFSATDSLHLSAFKSS